MLRHDPLWVHCRIDEYRLADEPSGYILNLLLICTGVTVPANHKVGCSLNIAHIQAFFSQEVSYTISLCVDRLNSQIILIPATLELVVYVSGKCHSASSGRLLTFCFLARHALQATVILAGFLSLILAILMGCEEIIVSNSEWEK